MKFLLGPNEKVIKQNLHDNHMYAEWVSMDSTFPSDFSKKVKDFLESHKESDNGVYLTYNVQFLNELDPDLILWIDTIQNEDGTEGTVVRPFKEVFEYWRGILPGDIFFMFVNSSIEFKRNKAIERDEYKIKYYIP